MGGWSQARYQRHAENFHLQHMKEVVGALDRMVRNETLNQVIVAADEVARPLFLEQLPQHLADKIVDVMALDMKTPDHQVLAQTMETLRQHDADTDVEHVDQMLGAWRAGGLAVAGPEETKKALEIQNVEELLIADRPTTNLDEETNEFIRGAYRNGARVRFIEDRALLADVGGVGALLRFKVPNAGQESSRPRSAPEE